MAINRHQPDLHSNVCYQSSSNVENVIFQGKRIRSNEEAAQYSKILLFDSSWYFSYRFLNRHWLHPLHSALGLKCSAQRKNTIVSVNIPTASIFRSALFFNFAVVHIRIRTVFGNPSWFYGCWNACCHSFTFPHTRIHHVYWEKVLRLVNNIEISNFVFFKNTSDYYHTFRLREVKYSCVRAYNLRKTLTVGSNYFDSFPFKLAWLFISG